MNVSPNLGLLNSHQRTTASSNEAKRKSRSCSKAPQRFNLKFIWIHFFNCHNCNEFTSLNSIRLWIQTSSYFKPGFIARYDRFRFPANRLLITDITTELIRLKFEVSMESVIFEGAIVFGVRFPTFCHPTPGNRNGQGAALAFQILTRLWHYP